MSCGCGGAYACIVCGECLYHNHISVYDPNKRNAAGNLGAWRWVCPTQDSLNVPKMRQAVLRAATAEVRQAEEDWDYWEMVATHAG